MFFRLKAEATRQSGNFRLKAEATRQSGNFRLKAEATRQSGNFRLKAEATGNVMFKITTHLICALALGVTATACNREATPRTEGAAATTGTDAGVTLPVADLVAEPEKYFGQTVTVVAAVEAVLGPRAFALGEDSPLSGGLDHDLLVFGRKTGTPADIDDQWLDKKVRVTGVVGRISVVDVEREIGWDMDPQVEVELERAGAVLIANSVTRVEK